VKFTLVLLYLVFGTGIAQAKGGACCACQTGTYPSNQVAFFSAGCKLWLAGQNDCDQSMTIPQLDGVSGLPSSCDGKVVKLGYVGHWSSAYQSANFLDVLMYEGVQKRQMSFEVDNTACRGMDKPQEVADRMASAQFPPGKYITYKSNQVISVGMWDGILVGKSNLWAQYDSRTQQTTYPTCKEFESKGCTDLGGVQANETGSCREVNGSLKELKCCPIQVTVTKLTAGKNAEPKQVQASALLWATQETCNRGKL
jgi:hypothetical protein